MSSPTILNAIASELRVYEPFSELSTAELLAFVRALSVHYFDAGEELIPAGGAVSPYVYIVKSGRVIGVRAGLTGTSVPALTLSPGEMFPIGAVLTERPTNSSFRADVDTLVYQIPTAQFKAFVGQWPGLQDFCERRLFNLLERSRAALRAAYAAESLSEHPFSRPLATVLKRSPVTCAGDATIESALRVMHAQKVGSVVTVDETGCAVGILTERDVVGRVVLPRVPLENPVSDVASAPVLSLDETQPISAAALLMVSRNIRHAVITRDEKVVGVVSERSLFALQRQSLASVSDAIGAAHDVSELERCAVDIRALSRTLVAQGVAAGLLTQFISQLNDQLTQRLIEISRAQHPVTLRDDVTWAWIAFGSEGRHEQTISTDQDNGLIFTVRTDEVASVREALLRFAHDINHALARCGFPLCKGNIMASNPALCLTADEWAGRFRHWIDAGDPQSLLNANIYFDCRALYGASALIDRLQDAVFPLAQSNSRFRKQMADNALTNRPPLTWLGQLEGSSAGTIDLKRAGAMPFTDAARLLALAHGVRATRTRDRLTACASAMGIEIAEVNGWIESFEFVQMLRLRHQHARLLTLENAEPVRENPNEIAIESLSKLDDRILREAFRQARKLQQRIEMDYQ